MKKLLEDISDIFHQAWMEYTKIISSSESISLSRTARWKKHWCNYDQLSEEEKEMDRKYGRKIMEKLEMTLD